MERELTIVASLRGKVCVVTGASHGIGRRLAIDLTGDGASVAMVARPSADLEAAGGEARQQGDASVWPADVCDRSAVKQVFVDVRARLGPVDAIINCAGIEPIATVTSMSIDDIAQVMQTNFMGMVHCVKEVLPELVARRTGCIVNLSSTAARFPLPRGSAYCASKAAITAFSEALHVELRPLGVHVLIVYPGYVPETRMARHHAEARGLPPRLVHQSLETVSRAVRQSMFTGKLQVFLPRYLAWSGVARDLMPGLTLRQTARLQG